MTGCDTPIAIDRLEAHPIGLDDQGYDGNGCYWGVGTPLYWVTTPDGKHDAFVRAKDAARARLIAAEEIPLRAWEREQAAINHSTPAIVEPEHLPDGRYGYPDALLSPPGVSGIVPRQLDSTAGKAVATIPARPARPAGSSGGSGPAGQAGPT